MSKHDISTADAVKVSDQVDHAIRLVRAARMVLWFSQLEPNPCAAAGDATPSDFGDPIITLLDLALDELRAIRDDGALAALVASPASTG